METAAEHPAPGLRAGLPRRLRAVGIHLAISAVFFGAALYLILAHWYPSFHFLVDGGWQGVRIMAAVDFVLGPLLTLIVFNPFKARRLIVLDLSCIGIAQFGALVWGFYAIHSQRPVAVSFHDGTFYSVTAEPLKIEETDPAALETLSDRRPPLVYVAPPGSEDETTRTAMQELVGMVMPHEDPFFFRQFDEHWPEVLARAQPAGDRSEQDAAFAAALPAFLAGTGQPATAFRFFPYEGRYGSCTLAFTPAGELAGALGCEKF